MGIVKVTKDTKDFNTALCGPEQDRVNDSCCCPIFCFVPTAAFCSIMSEVFTIELTCSDVSCAHTDLSTFSQKTGNPGIYACLLRF